MGKLQQRTMLFMLLAVFGLKLNHTINVGGSSTLSCVIPSGSHETVIRDYSVISLDRVRLIGTLIETCIARLILT